LENQNDITHTKSTFLACLKAGMKGFGIILGAGVALGSSIPLVHFANYGIEGVAIGAAIGAMAALVPALYAFECQWKNVKSRAQGQKEIAETAAMVSKAVSGEIVERERLREQKRALADFVRAVGFDPDRVADELSRNESNMCKSHALLALSVQRDFSNAMLSPAGVEASNNWLDSMMMKPASPALTTVLVSQ
jgi:hypothetical protein